MSREIKFRAWTGSTMEYRMLVGALGAFYAEGLDPKDSASISPANTIYPSPTPVMQFTGMKDKKGTEVYEGDILKATATNEFGSVETKILAVIWCSHEGNWSLTRTPDDLEKEHFIMGHRVSKDEVIGNIYENSELMK